MTDIIGSGTKDWEVIWNGQAFLDKVDKQLYDAMAQACEVVRRDAMKSMGPGTGRIYFRRRSGKAGGHWEKLVFEGGEYVLKSGKTNKEGGDAMSQYIMHQASSPGDPPAPDTGTLRRSLFWEVVRKGNMVLGYVGSNLKYAAALEYGTKDGKIAPRPYLRPARNKNRDRIVKIIAKALVVKG